MIFIFDFDEQSAQMVKYQPNPDTNWYFESKVDQFSSICIEKIMKQQKIENPLRQFDKECYEGA